jgi:hypothetical protein
MSEKIAIAVVRSKEGLSPEIFAALSAIPWTPQSNVIVVAEEETIPEAVHVIGPDAQLQGFFTYQQWAANVARPTLHQYFEARRENNPGTFGIWEAFEAVITAFNNGELELQPMIMAGVKLIEGFHRWGSAERTWDNHDVFLPNFGPDGIPTTGQKFAWDPFNAAKWISSTCVPMEAHMAYAKFVAEAEITVAKLINLTPHKLVIYDEQGESIITELEPSGAVARCAVESVQVGEVNSVPIFSTQFGEVKDLPKPEAEKMYIVSLLVRSALPNRRDLASPGELIRDAEGKPIGCKGLNINS